MTNTETAPVCRSCGHRLSVSFCDLGATPLSNAMVRPDQLANGEVHYPLHAWVCDGCFLVQLEQFNAPDEIFSDYVYFSSYSSSWLTHAAHYCQAMIERFGLGASSLAVELASNDGYLLKNFVAAGVPCLGVEPAANVAKVAREAGIDTHIAFFGQATATDLVDQGKSADLITANNVLAHVPDLNDFVAGMKLLLKAEGVITVEFPHLINLIRHCQFDTIYHEHFSYFSLMTVLSVFDRHGLRLFDVEELPTHGGSLRVYACHAGASHEETSAVLQMLENEKSFGLAELETYREFGAHVRHIKLDLLRFFVQAETESKKVACYGAAAKGNTLLNYCGIGRDFIGFAIDRNPHKQGLLLPGTHIPVHPPEYLFEAKPDYLLILPWNLKDEIMEQTDGIREWGGRFVTAVPRLEISP